MLPVSLLSRLAAFGPVGRCCPASRFVRTRRVVEVMGIVLTAAALSPAWAAGPQSQTQPQGTAAAAPPAAPAPNAGGSGPNAIVKAGEKTRVGLFWDCTLPGVSPVIWARADHGTATAVGGAGPQCGRPSMRMTGIFYTSEPGFKGTDTVHVLGFNITGKIEQSFTVLVK